MDTSSPRWRLLLRHVLLIVVKWIVIEPFEYKTALGYLTGASVVSLLPRDMSQNNIGYKSVTRRYEENSKVGRETFL